MAYSPQANEERTIKIVDFSLFTDNSDKQRVSDAILSSLKSIGFVYITNHGLPDEDVQAMFKWVRLVKILANHVLIKLVRSRNNFSPFRWKLSN